MASRTPFRHIEPKKDVRLPYTTTLTEEEVSLLHRAYTIQTPGDPRALSPGLIMRRLSLERAEQVVDMERARQNAMEKERHLRASVADVK